MREAQAMCFAVCCCELPGFALFCVALCFFTLLCCALHCIALRCGGLIDPQKIHVRALHNGCGSRERVNRRRMGKLTRAVKQHLEALRAVQHYLRVS